MRLWTLFGLREGKATTPWPLGEGSDGQEGVLGMPRFHRVGDRPGDQQQISEPR